MPSASLQHWVNDRVPRLMEIEAQCAASQALAPSKPRLREENLRGYIVLLSAHFQGFCRDLYTESAQITASRVRASLQVLIQAQFTAHRSLDHGNPNLQNLRKDFERFGFTLNLADADPGNPARLHHLTELNRWRNIAAHHGTSLLLASHRSPTYTIGGIPATVWRLRLTGSCTMNSGGYSGERPGCPRRRRMGRWPNTSRKNRSFSSSSETASRSASPEACAGRIVELRGPLGPGGVQVYRVLVRRKPEPKYIELMEDQLELVPAKG